jgi:hypothetical protein
MYRGSKEILITKTRKIESTKYYFAFRVFLLSCFRDTVVVKKTFRYSNVFLTTTYTIRNPFMNSGIKSPSQIISKFKSQRIVSCKWRLSP